MSKTQLNNIIPVKRAFAAFAFAVAMALVGVHAMAQSPKPQPPQPADLESQFQTPPLSAGPHALWFWMGTNISKEGITKDLQSMHDAGVGGANIMHVWGMVGNPPWPERTFRSEYYWEALRHAAAEADRLGMKITLTNGPGYTGTGGPWIDEKRNMRKLIWSVFKCGATAAQPSAGIVLPKPGQGVPGVKDEPGAKFYEDIAVLAVPDEKNIRLDQVVNLSGKLQADGKLDWKKPEGNWVVYRIGMVPRMNHSHPIDGGFGNTYEVDKLSIEDNIYHWRKGILEPLKQHLGKYFGTSFNGLHVDSYECGMQNWTGTFREVFLKRKGYDPVPWLASFGPPVLGWKPEQQQGGMNAGLPRSELSKFIDSEEKTLRFEWDFRENVSRMYNDCFKAGTRLMKADNFTLSYEPYGGPFNGHEAAAIADLSMATFWLDPKGNGECGGGCIAGARAAGSSLIGAESFTGGPLQSRWTECPADFKFQGDGAFASGINRFVYHHWVHQPFDDKYQPGMSFSHYGTHFSRFQTWYEPGKAYFKYVQRSQFLLQQGEQVVDCLSLNSDTKDILCDTISSYDFLNDSTKVENGQILLGSGRRYYYLSIPDGEKMLPEVAEKLLILAKAGAILVAPIKPVKSPSLQNYPECDKRVEAVAKELWESGRYAKNLFKTVPEATKAIGLEPDFVFTPKRLLVLHRRASGMDIYFMANRTTETMHERVSLRVAGKQPELWNAENGSVIALPVWEQANGRTDVQLDLGPKQSVFVVFREKAKESVHPAEVSAKEADANWQVTTENGKPVVCAASDVNVQVKYSDGKTRQFQISGTKQTTVEGAWLVAFTPKLGEPFQMQFPVLVDFSQHADNKVRYFSGTAVYRKEVQVDKLAANEGLVLDLGQLNDLASVRVNGGENTVLWYPPYRLDIGKQLKAGKNVIEIAVTNTWVNAIIGDEQIPADFVTKKTWSGQQLSAYPDWFVKNKPRPSGRKTFAFPPNYYNAESKPQPAGLVGPVRLVYQKQAGL